MTVGEREVRLEAGSTVVRDWRETDTFDAAGERATAIARRFLDTWAVWSMAR